MTRPRSSRRTRNSTMPFVRTISSSVTRFSASASLSATSTSTSFRSAWSWFTTEADLTCSLTLRDTARPMAAAAPATAAVIVGHPPMTTGVRISTTLMVLLLHFRTCRTRQTCLTRE